MGSQFWAVAGWGVVLEVIEVVIWPTRQI